MTRGLGADNVSRVTGKAVTKHVFKARLVSVVGEASRPK